MDPRNLIGSVKAAILVHALGWDAVAPLVDQLDPGEQRLIRKLQSNLGSISPALVERVAQEFLEKASPPKQIEGGVKSGTRRFAQKEPDDAHANNLKAIQSIAPDVLIQMIQNEHPQTIALMIAHLKPRTASEVMALLPDPLRPDVAYRIANLDKVASGMLEEIDRIFEEVLSNKATATTQKAGGVPRLAEILNLIDGTAAEQIIEEIEDNDPELAEAIRQNMFVFDDIVLVDDRGLQKVLRSIDSQELALALKAATDAVKEKIFANMSQRAVEIIKEEMDVCGAVRIKEVTDAQQKITRIVQDMERKGELVVSGRGGEDFVS